MIENIRAALDREIKRTGLKGKTLSRAAGLNESAVRDLLTKVDDPRIGTVVKLAKALGVPPGYLFDNFIPISGLIGVGGIVRFVPGQKTKLVPRPRLKDGDLVALQVVGETLRPAYRDGDVLFISRESDRIELDYLGDEVVAQLLDGTAYLRTLASGTKPGSHTLRHWNGTDTEDVALAWAAPVLFTMRRAAVDREGLDSDE
jgi:transcriptional regulator with XRE-family HTH domain